MLNFLNIHFIEKHEMFQEKEKKTIIKKSKLFIIHRIQYLYTM